MLTRIFIKKEVGYPRKKKKKKDILGEMQTSQSEDRQQIFNSNKFTMIKLCQI